MLHPNFCDKIWIADLPLCTVLLENEKNYPWILLIPKRVGLVQLMDVDPADLPQLMRELTIAQKILWDEFLPTRINVAAIGNKTPQLHLHVIARFASDPAWPGTVWDHPVRAKLDPDSLERRTKRLRELFFMRQKADLLLQTAAIAT